MASSPLWDQNHDINHSRKTELSSSTPGTRICLQEGGDSGSDTGSTVSVNGFRRSSVTDSSAERTRKSNMTSSGPGEPNSTVGDNASLSGRDRISSIHDNPFYKSFGVRHPRSPKDLPPLPPSNRQSDTESGVVLREELGDYKPGSGFVHRLRGKFASLSVREEVPQPLHVKQASSLEDINGGDKAADAGTASYEDEISPRERPRQRITGQSYGAKYRAKSVDSLNHAHKKPHLPVTLRHVERKWEPSTAPVRSIRDSHVIAPDVSLARDDIILIEKTPPQPPPSKEENDEDEGGSQSQVQVANFKAEVSTDELPKPNTVSTFRNFFESASQVDTDHFGRANKPLSPTTVLPHLEQSLGDKESRDTHTVLTLKEPVLTLREPVLTSREPMTPPREPVLTSRDSSSLSSAPRISSTPREPSHSLSSHSSDSSHKPIDFSRFDPSRYDVSMSVFTRTTDGTIRAAGSSDVSTTLTTLPSTTSSSAAVTSTAETKFDDVQTVSETVLPEVSPSSGSSESNRPAISPRSTAAVKAVPASRPAVPPQPTRPSSANLPSSGSSVPPSFTPSIKKTSPVMPVAPFKSDKGDSDDENRHLVYAKRKTGSKPSNAARVRDYGESNIDNTPGPVKKIEEKEKMEVESEVEKTNRVNLTHTKGRAPPIPRQRTEHSVTPVPAKADKTEDVHLDLAKPTSPRIEDSEPEQVTQELAQSVKTPVAAPRTFFSKPAEDESAMPEKSEEDSQNDEPVRGIPSIIAKRMKQSAGESVHSGCPGELFGVRLGKTRHTDSGDDGSEIPYKLAAIPAPEKQDEPDSSNQPSEIESQIASVRNRMQASSRNKSSGVSQIFDSSQLSKKRRENQEARKQAKADVPRLDLTSIASDDGDDPAAMGSYRVTPREIKPCNIEFIGGNVSLGRSLLAKNRKVKINICFHDVLVKTFEYPSEESALEEYMQEHPNEVLVLEDESGPLESSDDVDILDTPRGGSGGLESELLKSNTALSHSGSLQSYRSKYQQEYVLGSVLSQPEKEPEPVVKMEQVNPDSLQLRPADEEDTDTWSTSTNSDLLF